ncbi:MAG: aldehyde dehydrogenase family protein [Spirulinaceae cyanobacterium RM2_2_10]|nr:aldehyde dehydrogenase family protein [Spirulinaceae cyanobacterium SM2_1_0]NJO21260.1 aldehyde dehydrogenase family protein [Spirulinaceae cyanobacterium RM2_2_10]
MLTIVNPATEAILAQISEDNAGAIASKAAYARAAQRQWAQTSLAERCQIIGRFQELLAIHREAHAQTLTAEVGKPITQARAEIRATGDRLDFFLKHTAAALTPAIVWTEPTLTEEITWEPLGLVANISAWNYPYFVGSNVFIPALLAGNAVLYKPSEFATLTGQAIAQRLQEAGLPDGLFQLIVGDGATGAALLEQPVDGIFFTGSHATGRRIAAAAAKQLTKVQLELGGKDPAYVCEDVDLATAAASLAEGAFYNNGQSCCAVERIYVQQQIYEPFVAAFLETVHGFKLGDPTLDNTDLGPLTRVVQQAVLTQQIQDAVERGAKLLCGGQPILGAGYFFEPTVLSEVNHSMTVMQAESFGPVIGIQRVADDVEAVRLMADTPYGLTAGVYTRDRQRAIAILKQLPVGSAYWNCCDRVSPRLPWSGRGHSGLGLTLSTHGIRAFAQPKAWHLRSA